MSSAAAHAWHHIHFLQCLTGGGDATRRDITGPRALQLNGANHLSPTDKYQHCWCQSRIFILASSRCPVAKPGGTAPCWVLNLWAENTLKKEWKSGLILAEGRPRVEAWQHLGQSHWKKQISSDEGSPWNSATSRGTKHDRKVEARHKLDNEKYKE